MSSSRGARCCSNPDPNPNANPDPNPNPNPGPSPNPPDPGPGPDPNPDPNTLTPPRHELLVFLSIKRNDEAKGVAAARQSEHENIVLQAHAIYSYCGYTYYENIVLQARYI